MSYRALASPGAASVLAALLVGGLVLVASFVPTFALVVTGAGAPGAALVVACLLVALLGVPAAGYGGGYAASVVATRGRDDSIRAAWRRWRRADADRHRRWGILGAVWFPTALLAVGAATTTYGTLADPGAGGPGGDALLLTLGLDAVVLVAWRRGLVPFVRSGS